MLPDAVDDDAGGERVIRLRQPLRQLEPAAAVAIDLRRRSSVDDTEKGAGHHVAALGRVAADGDGSVHRLAVANAHGLPAVGEPMQSLAAAVLLLGPLAGAPSEHLAAVEEAREAVVLARKDRIELVIVATRAQDRHRQ